MTTHGSDSASPSQFSTDDGSAVGMPASLGRRAAARLVDGLILAVVASVVGMVLGLNNNGPLGFGGYITAALTAVVNAAIFLAYAASMETRGGQTVGKRCLGITVTASDGGRVALSQAVMRNIWLVCGVAAVVPVVGSPLGGLASAVAVVTIAIGIHNDDKDRRGWHDRLADGTRVVRS
jgi:uncharacterized RDD family membrane protein YckC